MNSEFASEPQRQLIRDEVEKRERRRWAAWTHWITKRNTRDGETRVISHFSPEFNRNCYLIIINEGAREKHRLILLVYENFGQTERNIHFIKIFTSCSLLETKERANSTVKKLLNEHRNDYEIHYASYPILALLEPGNKPIHFFDVVKKVSIVKENAIASPDSHIKKHDIIAVKINNTPSYHVAIYLGNNRIVHIPNAKGSPAKYDTLSKFLEGRDAKEIVSNRLIIPFQTSERIEDNIIVAIRNGYGRDSYNAIKRNCEHFAILCVTGIKFSSQVENLLHLNFRIDKEKVNEEALDDSSFMNQIQIRTTN